MTDPVIIEFGNPILRAKARRLSAEEIKSEKIQQLITNLKDKVASEEYGVGLAAPQIGESVAVSVIAVKPTPSLPERKFFEAVIINPEIIEFTGGKTPLWEGCMSFGVGEPVFAQVPRYKSIKVSYYDDNAIKHEETLDGFIAHVFQHETDHLNGVLFVDRVEDSKSWMNASEYKKMLKAKKD